jgi:type IV secretory pathway VirB10-like protein
VAVAAEVYKWVDEKGVTQYSAAPPPGVKATRVDTGAPLPAATASEAEAKARRLVEETNRRADERTREEVARTARDDTARRDAADRLQRCARGREQLDTVLRGGPVFHYNQRGEKVYLEDSARDAEIARLRNEVRAMCTGVPSTQDAVTRAAAAQADRMRECALARERVRELESGSSHIPAWMIEEARARAGRICASPTK